MKYIKTEFGKNILKLFSGEIGGRIVAFMLTPIITRLYLPDEIGVLSVFNSILAVIAPFACLKYPLAIPIVKGRGLLVNLIASALLILTATTTLTFIIFALSNEYILRIINMGQLIRYWYLIPILLFLIGIYEIVSNLCIRDKAFSLYSITSVSQKFLGSSVKILFGYLRIGSIGLLIGDILNQAGGVSIMTNKFWRKYRSEFSSISIQSMKEAIRKYIDFPKFRVPSQFFLAMTGTLPILYFSWRFEAGITGEISLARTVLSIPVTVIGACVGKAFYGEIAQFGIEDGDKIRRLTIKLIKYLFLFSLLPFSIIVLLGPLMFQFVFGKEWYDAGILAQIMSCYLIFQLCYSPISEAVFNVYNKQKIIFSLEVSRFILIISALAVAYICHMSALATIAFYSISLSLQYIISIVLVFKILKTNGR